MLEPEHLKRRVDRITWFHSIDLGNGLRTPGAPYDLTAEKFPDFSGRTTLDIGAWDGKYSFLAERQGAKRVVALDKHAWGVDMAARARYWEECAASGTLPDHDRDLTEFWRPVLPGRAGFELVKEVLKSDVEPMVADFMTMDLDVLGTFDIVLYLGVLYHIKEPLTALERVRAVTNEVAVIETAALWLGDRETRPLIEFFAANDLANDFGNWFLPTLPALHELCKAAGFAEVRTIVGPPDRPPENGHGGASSHFRALVHAYV